MAVEIGQQAPDFELRDQHGQSVRLSSFRGDKAVVVMFYPFAFSRVCTGELCEVRDSLPTFESDGGAAARGLLRHDVLAARLRRAGRARLPAALGLLAARRGGDGLRRLQRGAGSADRSTFIVDKDGVLRWTVHNAMPDARDLEEQARVLAQVAA